MIKRYEDMIKRYDYFYQKYQLIFEESWNCGWFLKQNLPNIEYHKCLVSGNASEWYRCQNFVPQ